MQDASNSKSKRSELLERLQRGTFPPAAVAGAFVSFASAALGSPARSAGDPGLVQIGPGVAKVPASPHLELQYAQVLDIKPLRFQRSLAGIAVGPADRIFAIGDGQVQVFGPDGTPVRKWRAPDQASCIAPGPDGRLYIGARGRVEAFDDAGNQKESFDAGTPGLQANITSIKISPKDIFVADAAARCIHRYDHGGKRLGEIGPQNKARGFMLPNRHLDMDVDAYGMVAATDPGRHRVTLWTPAGAPAGHFGKFGLANAEDFVGCCNPVNLAFFPDGRIVTAEKISARVKVYDRTGKLLSLIGAGHFDPQSTLFHLAVDSKNRILVGDPVRLEIKIFSAGRAAGGRENV